MDAIALLKADHKTVEALFKQFEKLQKGDGTPSQKKKVVTQIIKELATHASIEEQVFYPRVKEEHEEVDAVLEAVEEHHLVKITLGELEKLPPTDETYDAKVTVLIEMVRHHVKEEEHKMFPEVRSLVGRKVLLDLGAELVKARKAAPKTMQKAAKPKR